MPKTTKNGLSAVKMPAAAKQKVQHAEPASQSSLTPPRITPELFAQIILSGGLDDIHEKIAVKYHFDHDDIPRQSPVAVPGDPKLQAKAVLDLFNPDDLVACGDIFEPSGESDRWISLAALDKTSRENVTAVRPLVLLTKIPADGCAPGLERRFLVITTDAPDGSSNSGAVLGWLALQFQMTLRAVTTDLNGVHGWFDPVDSELEKSLAIWLPMFGLCEEESFDVNQRLMVPSATSYAKLLYLAE